MSGQMLAFFVSIGMLLLTVAAAVAVVALKRDRLLFPMLLGASACFVGQYLLFDMAYQAVMRLLTQNGVPSAPIVQIPVGIAFVALYETLLFLLVLGLGFRKRLRRRAAAAFGAGYWCFLALATAAVQLTDLLATRSMLFTGSELEILATGLQLPLELPLYIALSVMSAQLLLYKKPRYLFYALAVNLLFRLILATPQLFGVAMLVALGFLAMMSLLLVYYILRSRSDEPGKDKDGGLAPERPGDDEDAGTEEYEDGAKDAGGESGNDSAEGAKEDGTEEGADRADGEDDTDDGSSGESDSDGNGNSTDEDEESAHEGAGNAGDAEKSAIYGDNKS